MQADSIKIESEDDGFHLIVKTDAAHHDFRIQSCAEALHEQVNLIIGGWLAEGQAAARMPASAVFRCSPEDIDESGGYALDNPKWPGFHSIRADHYDNREKV